MQLYVLNLQDKVKLTPEMQDSLKKLAGALFDKENIVPEEAEVGISFVEDEEMKKLNSRYRDTDCTTDVLSFALWEGDEEFTSTYPGNERLLGDVVISLETAQRQAQENGNTLEQEVLYLAAHGLLHLLGYDHEDELSRQRMRRREKEILGELFS